jgi:DNA-binding transcriptional regulator YiaG
MTVSHPTPADVTALRQSVQAQRGIGITAAQDVCAEWLHTSRRAWQQWERGERAMHRAFWELAGIKARR